MSSNNNNIGVRMKENYEDRYRYSLPRRTFTIVRVDGKSFSTFTRNLPGRPFHLGVMSAMRAAAEALVKNTEGAKFAYTQSDEISLLLTDFENVGTQACFDGNIQKLASVTASIATAYFNESWFDGYRRDDLGKPALFDSRVFIIPDRTEVMNYFIWRNMDCIRNSIFGAARTMFSHKELLGVGTRDAKQMMLEQKGIDWEKFYMDESKYGSMVIRSPIDAEHRWELIPAWRFTSDTDKLMNLIPEYK